MNRVERRDEVMAFFNIWRRYPYYISSVTLSSLLFHRKVGVSAVVESVLSSLMLGPPYYSQRYRSQMGFQQQMGIPSGVTWRWSKGLFLFPNILLVLSTVERALTEYTNA
jgi:hypothetical protein